MISLRPHLLRWTTSGGEMTKDENGNLIPGTPGTEKVVPCRFHAENKKQFKNEAGTEYISQTGRIRVDVGTEMPDEGQEVEVAEGDYVHFKGKVLESYRGQLGWRLDV